MDFFSSIGPALVTALLLVVSGLAGFFGFLFIRTSMAGRLSASQKEDAKLAEHMRKSGYSDAEILDAVKATRPTSP